MNISINAMDDKIVIDMAKKGVENLLSEKTPSIVDMLMGRGTEKIIDSETLIEEIKERVSNSLNHNFMYSAVTEESEIFLRKKVLESMEMAVLFIDLVGSTDMILNLPKEKLATIFTTFAQEMAYVIKRHDGFVLKFVGDAVIGYFVAEGLSASVASRAVTCAESMLKVLKVGINPILKNNDLPELKVRIGIDYGENTIVRYGDDLQEAHVDILGTSVSMAAKIQNLAKPDQIMVGNDIYTKIHGSIQEYFALLKLDKSQWSYKSAKTGKIYPVYAYIGK
ncbi:Adenylyl cyclase class-3/4/guanylyl cyclase [Nitrosopumilus adriaticus]|uniref:Adenylyl cyclase class-3/4/guanylyl cyclase n=2 Tax=Nitrosopumilus adriaticus TaxID=1580092 RepID=A0A0D5C402_9ARCH|nr:Adenylyl cyclase class-3/4/guanylyl cyclase [Nitrosopumilus adriaticus]